MFDISENGKEVVTSYFKKYFEDQRNRLSACKTYKYELGNPVNKNKIKNLILTKSLIVKL